MIPLLLLGTPVTFEHACAFGTSKPYPKDSNQTENPNWHLSLGSPSWLSSFLNAIESPELMQSMNGHLSHVLGASHITAFNNQFKTKSENFKEGLCLLLACCEPQESLTKWRDALQSKGLEFQVIHGSKADLNERILLALSAHAQKLGLIPNVLREPPKERPRMGPCECCANAECERKLFDFLTQTAL